ncbi:MAG TPA: hypothetical protein VIG82_03940 [Enteractinococcus sp.]
MELPWFAWIAIVAIIMWGLVTMVGSITGRPHRMRRLDRHEDEIEQLKRRTEQLEAHLYRSR